MGIFGNEIKDVEKDDGRKPSKQSGEKPDTRKRISGGEIFYVISLRKAAFVDTVVGVNDIFAQSHE